MPKDIREILDEAMRRDDPAEVEAILRSHPELKDEETGVGTLIHSASTMGSINTVKRLVALGFDVNTPSSPRGRPPEGPIFSAVNSGNAEVVRWLLEQGARSEFVVNDVAGKSRNFALGSAIMDGRLDLVKLLVEYGADVNVLYAKRTPLIDAQRMGHEEIAEYLRSKGAKLPEDLGHVPPQKGTKKKGKK